jgi:hypothetical protein
VDIDEQYQHAFYFLLTSSKRSDPEPIPTALLTLDFPPDLFTVLDYRRYQFFEVWNVDTMELIDGPADVAREQPQ